MRTAAVNLWGRRIGAVTWNETHASFEFDRRFVASNIEVSPLHMPLDPRIYQFPGLPSESFKGLPGLLADSLPDRYGNALIDAWLARQGRTAESFHPVERLCYVGSRGMGALEYEPAAGPESHDEDIDVARLVELAELALAKHQNLEADVRHDERAMNQVLQVGTSAGGARAKAVVGWNPQTGVVRSGQVDLPAGFEPWILKLDGVATADDREIGVPLGYGLIEYAYHRLAMAAGIVMSPCDVLADGERRHFMTRRFDRTAEGKKVHMQTLAALAHFDFHAAGAYSYEQAVDVMRQLSLTQAEIEQQFRRAVFNVIARNQDDHVKNIAFLMDKRGRWSLSPAYDVTFAFNPRGRWTSRHQMRLNGKLDDFREEDLMTFGRFCDLKPSRARSVVDEVVTAVESWPELAQESGVPLDQVHEVQRRHRSLRGGELR